MQSPVPTQSVFAAETSVAVLLLGSAAKRGAGVARGLGSGATNVVHVRAPGPESAAVAIEVDRESEVGDLGAGLKSARGDAVPGLEKEGMCDSCDVDVSRGRMCCVVDELQLYRDKIRAKSYHVFSHCSRRSRSRSKRSRDCDRRSKSSDRYDGSPPRM